MTLPRAYMNSMTDHAARYQAVSARDPRFDGVFFTGVTSTGIYCRPICPARTPKAVNCTFYDSAVAAEKAGFRPCLRCRPELAPGSAPVDDARRIAHLIVQRIGEGLVDDNAHIDTIAAQFEISARQLRRIVQKELGVSPIELIQTRRLLLAKQLLTETALPVTEIAYASGFASLRRFNDAFRQHYRMPPTQLRKKAGDERGHLNATDTSVLQMAYRPPYDWDGMLEFLQTRLLQGTEAVAGDTYYRTVRLGECTGWIAVRHAPEKNQLHVEFTHSLAPVLPALLGRLRNLFDLDARPDLIAAHLRRDALLKKAVAKNPGLRVPGAFCGFDLAVRAILGQQVTVKAATTLATRFVTAFGEKIETPVAGLDRLAPLPERVARLTVDSISKLGIVSARSKSIIALAKAFAAGDLQLSAGADPERLIAQLTSMPGIGPWTAHYIAMRALRWPDAFPKEDIAVRNRLGGLTAKQAEERSQPWRPWRSYATLHIWHLPPG